MKKLIASIITTLMIFTAVPARAADFVIQSTQTYTSYINGTPLWSAELPSAILLTGKYSAKIEFPIQAIAPYDLLADKSLGVDVDFELWSASGKKLAYDTIYSFSWNPVSPNNIVSFYLYPEDMIGTAILVVSTEQTVRTNGLLSSYLQDKAQFNVSLASGTVPAAPTISGTNYTTYVDYRITPPVSSHPVTEYEVNIAHILNNNYSPSSRANFSTPTAIKTVTEAAFQLQTSEIQQYLQQSGAPDAKYVLVYVRAKSAIGFSDYGYGIYTEMSQLALTIPKPVVVTTTTSGGKWVVKITNANGKKIKVVAGSKTISKTANNDSFKISGAANKGSKVKITVYVAGVKKLTKTVLVK